MFSFQADVSYNIPEVQEEPAFDLSVKVKRVDDVLASPLTTETGEELCGPLEMQISARCGLTVVIKIVEHYCHVIFYLQSSSTFWIPTFSITLILIMWEPRAHLLAVPCC